MQGGVQIFLFWCLGAWVVFSGGSDISISGAMSAKKRKLPKDLFDAGAVALIEKTVAKNASGSL